MGVCAGSPGITPGQQICKKPQVDGKTKESTKVTVENSVLIRNYKAKDKRNYIQTLYSG